MNAKLTYYLYLAGRLVVASLVVLAIAMVLGADYG